jgi:Ca2+-transporting ATPase
MIDPPREGVKEAVATCKKAGIKTVMITGDHIVTATAIAKELGILKPKDMAITGTELDKISDKELEKNIMNYSVFARVSPEHKVRIVKAYRSTGAVVAMTGDGVNDAPALKNADIGIAMGKNGTDVAKNAADMVLTDDNFVTIVKAVKQGRNIFDNIRKAVHFLISTNIGEIVTIFLGLLLGLESPLLAIQLLWINLVTDSIPAIALGLERPDTDIMNRKPQNSKKGIFANGLWGKIIVEGTMLGMLTLLAFSIGSNVYGLETGRTMAFLSLGLLELVHCFNIKSEESIFKSGFLENRYLVGAFVIGAILQVGVVFVPALRNIFNLVTLDLKCWLYVIAISIAPLFIIEIQKKLNEVKFGKVVYGYKNKMDY